MADVIGFPPQRPCDTEEWPLEEVIHEPKHVNPKPYITHLGEVASILENREAQYGDTQRCLESIADAWSWYLGYRITSYDVCQMMVLMKMSRTKTGGFSRDSAKDQTGYSALADGQIR